jgi:hypothetical protein
MQFDERTNVCLKKYDAPKVKKLHGDRNIIHKDEPFSI